MGFKSTFKNLSDKIFTPGSFVQNVAFSLSGNATVLGIGFLLTPLVARIYGPEAYGEFAIFTAVAGLIQPISTFQLPAGYVAAKSDEQFAILIKISFLTLIIISIFTGFGAIIYYSFNIFPELSGNLALFMPIYILLSGVFEIGRGWNIKLQEFKRSAQSKVVATVVGKSTTIGYGWFLGQNALGMVLGSIATFLLEAVGYVSNRMYSNIVQVFNTRINRWVLKETIKDFAIYPKYVTTNSIINNLSMQVPIYFIAAFYSVDKVGLFSLSLSLITIPVYLFGTSVGSVFLPKISAIIDEIDLRNKTVKELYHKIFYPGLFGLFLLAFALKLLLPFILGESWSGTSQLAALIAISFAFSLVSQPLANTYRLMHFENANLVLTIIFLSLKVIVLWIAANYGDLYIAVFAYLMVGLIHNATQVFVLFVKLNISSKFIIRDLLVVILSYILVYIII